VCRDPVGIIEVEETFQGFREEKLRRKSAFEHKSDSYKECRGRRILQGFKEEKAQEEYHFHGQAISREVVEANENPLEGLSSRSSGGEAPSRMQTEVVSAGFVEGSKGRGLLKLGKYSKVGRNRAHKEELQPLLY
jgi:hypothetical protein